MHIKKTMIIIIPFLFLMLIPSASALYGTMEEIAVGEYHNAVWHLYNETTGADVTGASCSVTILWENLTERVTNVAAEEVGNGWYNYTANWNETGIYYGRVNCSPWNNGNAVDFSFEIVDKVGVLNAGGTEYTPDEEVQIRVQYFRDGTPISDEYCEFNLFAPNETKIFNGTLLTYINDSRGFYGYNWSQTDKDPGAYTVDAYCRAIAGPAWLAYVGYTFKVSPKADFYEVSATLGFGIFAFIFAFLSINMHKKHGTLQLLFLFLSIFTIFLGTGIIIEIGEEANVPSVTGIAVIGLKILTWVIWLLVAYFLVYFIYQVAMKMADKKEKGFGEEL